MIETKAIFLIDYHTDGHHSSYAVLFSKLFISAGLNVVLLYPKAIEDSELLNNPNFCHLKTEKLKAETYRFEAIKYWLKTKIDIRNAIMKINKEPDLVYFLWADILRFPKDRETINWLYLFFVKKNFKFRWAGLYFHPTHYRIHNPELFYKDAVFSLNNCVGVHILDEGLKQSLENEVGEKVLVLPDITTENIQEINNDMFLSLKKQAGSKIIIGCCGAIAPRKGVIKLLEISNQLPNHFIIIAGKLNEATFSKDELNLFNTHLKNNPNVLLIDRFISDVELNTIYKVSDLVWAAYIDFPHSSGAMTKAAMFKKPVIVSKGFLMGERTLKYNLGLSINLDDIESTIRDIENVNTISFDHNNMTNFFNEHSFKAMQEKITSFLNQTLKI
jgi:glycosyltransferase involved in cell wall biosynthesis